MTRASNRCSVRAMRVVFQQLTSPCVVSVEGELRELWPIVVDVSIGGRRVPVRFAWDRHNRVLRVDERWEGRALLGDARAIEQVSQLAREALSQAASHASKVH